MAHQPSIFRAFGARSTSVEHVQSPAMARPPSDAPDTGEQSSGGAEHTEEEEGSLARVEPDVAQPQVVTWLI